MTPPSTRRRPSRRSDRRPRAVPAISSVAALAGVAVVVVALLGFFVTGSPDRAEQAAAQPPASTAPPTSPAPTPTPARRTAEVPRAYVQVFNNTRTTGLAADAARRVEKSGWKVVGTDNWNGNIPATTVYYPARLKAQAKQLARDVGVDRLRPSVDPMRTDRLTVILTGRL